MNWERDGGPIPPTAGMREVGTTCGASLLPIGESVNSEEEPGGNQTMAVYYREPMHSLALMFALETSREAVSDAN